MQAMLGKKTGYGGDDLLTTDEKLGFSSDGKRFDGGVDTSIKGIPSQFNSIPTYTGGQFVGADLKRSQKLNMDPIMELKHVIGYSPSACLNLKWSRLPHENIVVFSSAGVLITMDVETMQQKRFFFGHSAPISCFDIASHGALLASAQEGKNSIIRIWDYHTARCLSMLPMPVVTMKCLSFSPDGRFLASVGKDAQNKELIIVWDISKIHRNEKPEILARQTSEFNILSLKFSPVDNFRLVSCGKENIRFWRIKETGNIRGSAVVLN
jgi:WD40 repeat protein